MFKLFERKKKTIKVFFNLKEIVFMREEESKKDIFTLDEENFIEIKNYLDMHLGNECFFIIYLSGEIVREDVFCFDKRYKKNAAKISFWEIIRKYNCEVDEIKVAQKVDVQKDQIKVRCFSIKKDILGKIKEIFENYNRVIKVTIAGNEEINFLENIGVALTKFNSAATLTLMTIMVFCISTFYFLGVERKKLEGILNNSANKQCVSIMNVPRENINKLIIEKSNATKRGREIINSLASLGKIIGGNAWIEEYLFTENEEIIKGYTSGEFSILLKKLKKEYNKKVIFVDSLKEDQAFWSFCLRIKKS